MCLKLQSWSRLAENDIPCDLHWRFVNQTHVFPFNIFCILSISFACTLCIRLFVIFRSPVERFRLTELFRSVARSCNFFGKRQNSGFSGIDAEIEFCYFWNLIRKSMKNVLHNVSSSYIAIMKIIREFSIQIRFKCTNTMTGLSEGAAWRHLLFWNFTKKYFFLSSS